MARIIGTAGIRLTAEGRGLDNEIRRILEGALRSAGSGLRSDLTGSVRDDADRTSSHVRGVLTSLQGVVGGLAGTFARTAAAGVRLTLVGAAAGIALAGVTSLVTGVIGLVGVLGQAAGVAGLLPAAFLALQAGAATLKIGLSGISEAFKAVGGDAAAFEESIKNLAPAAQSFMREIRALNPALEGLKLGVQERLFSGLSGSIQGLADRYLPVASSMFNSIATSINGAGKQLTAFALQGEVVGQVSNLTGNLAATFQNLAPAITPAASGLLDFTEVGSRFLPMIGYEVQQLAVKFGEFMREAAGSGQLEAFFKNAIQAAKDLFAAARDIGVGLGGIFQAAQAAGGGFLVNLRSMAAAFREFTTSAQGQEALIGFFTSMKTITASVLPVFAELASVIGSTVAPILADIASTVGPALLSVVKGIGGAFKAAAPGIATLAEGVAALLEGIAPLLPVIGQLAGIVGGALGEVFKALAPVLKEVAEVMAGTLAEILPQLQPVFEQLATAVAELFRAAMPLIPLFLQLIAAVLPLLAPLIQLVSGLLPPIISLITALMPLIQALAAIFAALLPPILTVAQTILGILIPPLNLIITVVANVAAFVAQAFQAMSGVINTILSAISAVITGIWGGIFAFVSGIVNAMGSFIRGAFEGIRTFFSNVMGGIGRAVSDGVGKVVRFFRDLPGKILEALGDLATLLWDAGVQLVKGFIDGIKNMISDAVSAVSDMVSSVVETVTSGLRVFSPSRVFRDIGENTGLGFALGIRDMIPAAVAATEAMTSAVTGVASNLDIGPDLTLANTTTSGTGQSTSTTAGIGGVVLNQTNIMRPGADVTQFATEVYRNGAHDLASAASTIGVRRLGVQRGMPGEDFVTGAQL